MFKPLKHPNVRILEGLAPLIGKTGVITDKEGKLYRVKLDEPVEVDGVGIVTDDLWMPAHLKVIRPGAIKPVVVGQQPEAPAVVESPVVEAVRDELITRALADQLAPEATPVVLDTSELDAAIDVDTLVPDAPAEVTEAAAPAKPAPQPGPEAGAPEAATPATPAARKPKTKKVKALSAKAEAQLRAGVKVTDEAAKAKKGKVDRGVVIRKR